MTQTKNLELHQNGTYYLRIQRNGVNRRISLKTSDFRQAQFAAHILHATLSSMKIDPTKIKEWTLEVDGDKLKISTDNTPEDRASALEAVKARKIKPIQPQIPMFPANVRPIKTRPAAILNIQSAPPTFTFNTNSSFHLS